MAKKQGAIIVIGGGMAGCSLAYQLARRGRKVILVEQRNIVSGATGRCGGMVMKIDGRDTDPAAIAVRWQYVMENDRMLNQFQDDFGIDFGLRRRGSLDIAFTDDELDLLERVVRIQREELDDREIKLLDKKELLKLSPVLGDNVKGARFRPSDGCLDPFKLSHLLLSRAVEEGAVVRPWTRVNRVIFKGRRVQGVETDRGIIEGEIVVNATNGWAQSLTPEIPVIPLRSLAVITEPAPPVPALTFEAELHAKIVYGCTQTARGNILVGGPPELPATRDEQFNERVSFHELVLNTSVLTEIMPALKNLNVIRSWSGAMGITPDGLPCVGQVQPYEGLFVAAGYPNGMAYTSVTARLLAELVVEGAPSIPLEPLDPMRFAGKKYDWPEKYDYTILAEYLGRAG